MIKHILTGGKILPLYRAKNEAALVVPLRVVFFHGNRCVRLINKNRGKRRKEKEGNTVFVSPAKQKRDICIAFSASSLSSSSVAAAAAAA